jgi:uncharacterized protein YgbK (DUF1537 family)
LPFLIVADDLTGACDSAAGFLRAGQPVTVALQDAVVEEVDGVVAIDTDTRGLDEAAARRRLEQLVARLPAGQPVFKKIDSLLRGHVSTELAVLRDWFPDRLVVVAPAFPANGRTTRRGVQQLDGRPLLQHGRALGDGAAASDVLARVLEPHRSRRVTPERLDRSLVGVVTCDAETDDDLDRIVAALDRRVADVIWVGSGGLSAALARSLGGPATAAAWEPPSRVVAVVGSTADVAVRQARALEGHAELATVDAVGGLVHDGPLLILVGGATARHVLDGLGVRALELVAELEPGVVLAHPLPRRGSLKVVTKSGTFGDDETLVRVIAAARAGATA